MAATFAFLGTFLISLVVALLAAFLIGDYFKTGDEFILVVLALTIFIAAAIVAAAIGSAVAKRVQTLNWVAFALAAAAFAPVSTPRLVEWIAARSSNPHSVGIENSYLTLEILIPALLAVLVQWGLARRHWLRARGFEDLARWPWLTTAIASLAALNPIGLTVIASLLERSPANFMWRYFAMAAAAAAAALIAMALVECYIRGRILRRRLAARSR